MNLEFGTLNCGIPKNNADNKELHVFFVTKLLIKQFFSITGFHFLGFFINCLKALICKGFHFKSELYIVWFTLNADVLTISKNFNDVGI